jgi:hypothetical protein|tara:strand:+ start:1522 stop:1956 length:435 start_codon:yes stop_codon:yes gene_type:complete
MLYEFKNYNKHGNTRTRIIPFPNGKAFGVNPSGLGGYIGVRIFKYEYKHELIPPSLANIGSKRYILPTWQEVLPETELKDIKWIKPKPKRAEVIEHKFKSSCGKKTYTTKKYIATDNSVKYSCNCFGAIRAKDGRCTHIKSIEK